MPLQRRVPKRGFRNPGRQEFAIVNVRQLESRFEPGAIVDPDALRQCGLVRKSAVPVKVLAAGELSKPLTVRAHRFSRAAREKIAAAGGTAEELARA